MQQAVGSRTRAPVHVWIIGVASLLWNMIGAIDYTMTRLRNIDYLASMMPGVDPGAMLAWVDAFPVWAQFGWGLGVWCGLVGSMLLLMRSRYAVHAFALSLIGILLGIGYQIALAPPPPGVAEEGALSLMPYMVIVVGLALLLYARTAAAKGVLR